VLQQYPENFASKPLIITTPLNHMKRLRFAGFPYLRHVLYVVATPIGNLSDLSARALETLKNVDVIVCEDTRVTGPMLRNAGIMTPLESFHTHNEHTKTTWLTGRMLSGSTIALVSDAGTPAISDPGFLLVREAHRAGVQVCPIPGPSAAIAALSASGLPTDRFTFEGFLPQKKGRQKRLQALVDEDRTMLFYESPHRIARFADELEKYFGSDRPCTMAREITKKFEEIKTFTIAELKNLIKERDGLKGELVIIVAGRTYAGTLAENSDGDEESDF
jgi:16S rRNA (cytidine1402-2'-O)-methyltransferase